MPIRKKYWMLRLGGKTRVFLRMEAGLTGVKAAINQFKARTATKATQTQPELGTPRSRSAQRIARRDQKTAGRRTKLTESDTEAESRGIKPENIIWIFGSGRTGSTWLGRMMDDLKDHVLWHEPYVGEIFGSAYYVRAWDRQREREGYILSRQYREVWLKSMRALILDGAEARYPEADGYLVIKEPHGSIAAPLLMEALPESRMVFLVRDPRDVVASRLDAHRKGSWTQRLRRKNEETLADKDPDAFVEAAARMYLRDMEQVKHAYDAFDGHKALVMYEKLRTDTLRELEGMYFRLGITVAEEQLQYVVEKHDWENIPNKRKGAGKSHRKATPGGWREDLTPEQATSVERITAPILDEFYAD
jgi:Sulfotransferase family